MKVKYTVVIPERDEENNLKHTINNIINTQNNCTEIQHVKDTTGKGTSFSRHIGTMKAENEIIISCDAHMRFAPEALDNMANYIADNNDILCCLKCHHNEQMDFNQPAYNGADLLWKQEETNNNRVLSAIWRGSTSPGEIGSVMGACYGLKKSSYSKMGNPWSMGVAWGNDEETISIAMRLIGGKVELLEYRCAHKYNASVPYKSLPTDAPGIWYNRIRNLYYLPIHPELAYELREYVLANPDANNHRQAVLKMLEEKKSIITQSASILKQNQIVSFEDYAQKWLIGYPKNI